MTRPMLRSVSLVLVAAGLSGCVYAPAPPVYSYNAYDPGERAAGGALVGAGAGAALGALAGGGRGAAIGALAGGALGAATGAASTPSPPPAYGYGYGYDGYGYYGY